MLFLSKGGLTMKLNSTIAAVSGIITTVVIFGGFFALLTISPESSIWIKVGAFVLWAIVSSASFWISYKMKEISDRRELDEHFSSKRVLRGEDVEKLTAQQIGQALRNGAKIKL